MPQPESLEEVVIKSERKKIRNIAPRDLPLKEKLAKKNYYNILNQYRSYSYIITISCLDRVSGSNPEIYRKGEDVGNVILKSSGKKNSSSTSTQFVKLIPEISETAKQYIDYFNSESSGRFNLYINDLEIETFPSFESRVGTAVITKIRFNVHEPYSIVGFLEALEVASLAAGFKTYLDATFLLKIQFIGYKDDVEQESVEPEVIPMTTRYIPFKFSKVDVDFNESGTVYKCDCFPANELALTDVYGSVQTPIALAGNTVKEVLKNLVDAMNKAIKDESKEKVPGIKDTEIDEYFIEFPEKNEDNTFDPNKDNEIASKPIKTLYSDSGLIDFGTLDPKITPIQNAYQLVDAASTATTTVSKTQYEPSKFKINFGPGTYVQAIIDGVIRDSEYWREQVDPASGKVTTDESDHVNFWKIVSMVEQGSDNPVRGRPKYKITYRVIVSKIHITQIPGFRTTQRKDNGAIRVVREYNYIYTGQNVDIQKLNISFDKLFYERYPWRLGDSKTTEQQNTVKAGDSLSPQFDPLAEQANQHKKMATANVAPVNAGGSGNAAATGNAYAYARESFNQVVLSNVSMIKLDMDIIGDPVFVMTGGIGNYFPSLLKESDSKEFNEELTGDGEASGLSKNVYIKVYFRSGMDIDELSLEKGGTGLLKFNQRFNLSGYYMLIQAVSSFRDGMFTQKLKMTRMMVELNPDDYKSGDVDTKKKFKTVPNPDDQVRENAGEGENVPANERSSLKDLLSGVNKFADSLKNVENNIVDAIEGAATSVAEAVAAPVQIIAKSANKIAGAVQGIDDAITDVADQIGLTTAQLNSLSAGELAAMLALSKLLPDNVSLGDIENRGIIVSKDKIKTVPPKNTNEKLDEVKILTKEERDALIAETFRNNLQG